MGMARGETSGDRGAGGTRGEPVAAVAIGAIVGAAYAEHAAALRTRLTGVTRDTAAADDLVQETYVRLLTEVAAGRQPVHLRAWLFRVGANLAASRGRRQGVAARRASELLRRDVVRSPEDELLDREQASDVHGRLARLAPSARLALLLAAHGYTGAEIAAHIGRTPLATRSLICRARGRLRHDSVAA
jgi:RNA polymerase sigma factor (sigma-70 family)